MLIGYARASTDEYPLGLQVWHLNDAGCQVVFEEALMPTDKDRPALERMLRTVGQGDVVTVYRLDRLARSTRHLLEIAECLASKDAGLRSITEPWADTTAPDGRTVMTVFAGIADFERTLLRERTAAGRAQARERGTHMGRPAKLTPSDTAQIYAMVTQGGLSVSEVSARFNVHKATVYRIIARLRAERG